MAATIEFKNPGLRYPDQQRTFADAQVVLISVLGKIGYYDPDEVFTLMPIEQVRWKSGDRFKAVSCRGHSIRVRIKPGDNSTAFEYNLIPPHGTDADWVLDQLLKVRLDQTPEQKKVETQSTPAMIKGNGADVAPATTSTQLSIMERLASLERSKGRIAERKGKLEKLEQKRVEMQAEVEEIRRAIEGVDKEILAVMDEDESDHEAKDAVALIEALDRLLAPK
jgi:hypothetical protein